jgi:hypothetical protein
MSGRLVLAPLVRVGLDGVACHCDISGRPAMSVTREPNNQADEAGSNGDTGLRLEVVVIPVADVDRAAVQAARVRR